MDTATNTSKLSVLLVDDDPFFHMIVREMLDILQVADLTVAHNGKEALQVLSHRATPPDVMICDVFMPDMDGLEILDKLSDIRFGGRILMVSGGDASMLNLSQFLGKRYGLNIVASVVKPLTLEQLADALGVPEQ